MRRPFQTVQEGAEFTSLLSEPSLGLRGDATVFRFRLGTQMLLAHHRLFNLCPDENAPKELPGLTIYAAEIATKSRRAHWPWVELSAEDPKTRPEVPFDAIPVRS